MGGSVNTWGWDTDGSYADWYGGHEIAHAYNRSDAEFCGATGGEAYPYPDGSISPASSGDEAIYGFDAETWAIYDPTWKDVMTYCDYQWISDFTYEELMDYFQAALEGSGGGGEAPEAGAERLLVVGSLEPAAKKVHLLPIFTLPGRLPLPEAAGAHAIVLRNRRGVELLRKPFQPRAVEYGRLGTQDGGGDRLAIAETVPLLEGVARVDIEGPDGLLHSVSAGLAPPEVTVTQPNGGESFRGGRVTVAWRAEDADGDALAFNVQYSPDGGETWKLVALNVSDRFVEIDESSLPAGMDARFRVWATDGIHTARDESDAGFTVANHLPEVEIAGPQEGIAVAANQTLHPRTHAYDSDVGLLRGAQISWESNLDGAVGHGRSISLANLSVGSHRIVVRADDGQGGVVTDTVEVNVASLPSQESCSAVTELKSASTQEGVGLAWRGGEYESVEIHRDGELVALLEGSAASHLDRIAAPGVYLYEVRAICNVGPTGAVFASAWCVVSHLSDWIQLPIWYLRSDCNGDGSIGGVSDPVFLLIHLFLGESTPSCLAACDANGDGAVSMSDAIYTLTHSFLGGPAPPPPYPVCGEASAADEALGCAYPRCP